MAFLTEFERKLDIPPAEKTQVMREMRSHYEELREELIASGMDAATAEQEAARRLGDPQDVASRLGTVHCRATWRTALLMVLPFLMALFIHWHSEFISYGLKGGSAYLFVSDPRYVYAQVGSLVILSLICVLMIAVSARELKHSRRPMWLAVWTGVGLWSLISIPFLSVLLYGDGAGQLGIVHLVVSSETLALGIGATWISSKWRTALGAGALIAALAVAITPWAPSDMLVVMLLQAPFIMIIARRLFGSHPYGNSAQTSLFLFAFYASSLSYMIAKAPTGVPILPLLMSVVVVAILLIYARASAWESKVLALAIGIEMVGLLSASWGDIPMSHYSVGSGPGSDVQWGVLLTFLLCWVILVPMHLGRRESPPAITTKENKQMRRRRWGRRLLITLGVIAVINFIGGMVMDRQFFHTTMANGTAPTIAHRPPAADYSWMHGKMKAIPSYDAAGAGDPWAVDLRSADLSAVDAAGHEKDLVHADFDSRTKWPAGIKGMKAFRPDKFMELGKNPGLGLKALHKKGVTGKGVGVAIIDYPLLVDHAEVKGRVKMYEEIHCADDSAQMHGCATSSIAVGRSVGVAPGADLYFVAVGNFHQSPLTMVCRYVPALSMLATIDYGPDTRAIDRIVEINRHLPKDRKIRVISISQGYMGPRGWRAYRKAIESAENEGIFVVTCGLETTSGGRMRFNGLGREPLANPDDPASYGPGGWLEKAFFGGDRWTKGNTLWVPMDSRCTASPTGNDDYVFYRSGGWSWAAPYIAGLYALACQVKPSVTPQEFWKAALETGDTVQVTKNGVKYPLGKIVNPAKLIARLQSAGK